MAKNPVLKSKEVQEMTQTCQARLPIVLKKHPKKAKRQAKKIQTAIDNNENIAPFVWNMMILDPKLAKMARKKGMNTFATVQKGDVEFACGGACIFLGGMVVGYLLAK